MKAIAITDARWGIAKNGRQVFFIPEDLAFFKGETLGSVVVMGRKTLEALPGGRPLPGRVNVVLTRGAAPLPGGCVAATLETLPGVLEGYAPKEVYVAGGGAVYRALLPFCGEALVTRVFEDAGADVFFPDLDEKNGWKIEDKSQIKTFEGMQYQFLRYRNLKPRQFGGV